MASRNRNKVKLPIRAHLPDNTPYKGVHVDRRTNGTAKLFINDYLIVYCPYGHWYWKTPAYKPEYAPITEWFMTTYFPNMQIRTHGYLSASGYQYLEPIKEKQEAHTK